MPQVMWNLHTSLTEILQQQMPLRTIAENLFLVLN